MTTAAQAATAATLGLLDAPTPWHPRDANGRVICDALGRPRVLVLPVHLGCAAEDHALAVAIARFVNEQAGEDPAVAEHMEARPVFERRVGGLVGA